MREIRNSVRLIGNLGADIELRELDAGKKVAQISLATDASYKNKNGEWQDRTHWHKLVVWDKLAERMASKLEKGDRIAVEGRLDYNEYTDSNEIKRTRAEIVVRTFKNLTTKKEETAPF